MKVTVIKPEDIYKMIAEGRIKSQSWLAAQMGFKSTQALNKRMVHGGGFNDEELIKLNEILKREGVIADANEQASLLITQTMCSSGIINQALAQLNEITLRLAGDSDGLNFDDKRKILDYYDEMLDEIKEKIYDLRRVVEGRK